MSLRRTIARTLPIALSISAMSALALLSSTPSEAAINRSFGAGRFALEVNGSTVGLVEDVEGGNPTADVISERNGPDTVFPRKHLGPTRYEEISVSLHPSSLPGMMGWISPMLTKRGERRNGAIIATDFDMKQRSRLVFTDALITEISFPALDAGAGKEPYEIGLKFAPQVTRQEKASGPLQVDTKVKRAEATRSSFRLNIAGLEQASTRVVAIEPFTITQKLSGASTGESRNGSREPAAVELSNLVLTINELDAAPFVAWAEDVLVRGKSGPEQERRGTLELLNQAMTASLFTLDFKQLGIFAVKPLVTGSGERPRRVSVSMYVGQVGLSVGAKKTASINPQSGFMVASLETPWKPL